MRRLTQPATRCPLCITMIGVMALWGGAYGDRAEIGFDCKADERDTALHQLSFSAHPERASGEGVYCHKPDCERAGAGLGVYACGVEGDGGAGEAGGGAGDAGYLNDGKEVGGKRERVASNEMCTFLILNISSLQLIPVNMIAYRSQYGSVNPAEIIAPAIVATLISTLVAVVYCKGKDMRRRR